MRHGKRSVGRPQARWSDGWQELEVRVERERKIWQEVGETYVQQWTVVG
jgi:hypothetical protein